MVHCAGSDGLKKGEEKVGKTELGRNLSIYVGLVTVPV